MQADAACGTSITLISYTESPWPEAAWSERQASARRAAEVGDSPSGGRVRQGVASLRGHGRGPGGFRNRAMAFGVRCQQVL